MNQTGELSHCYGDTIPAPPPCAECDRLGTLLVLSAQIIDQLRHEVASLRALLPRALPEGMWPCVCPSGAAAVKASK